MADDVAPKLLADRRIWRWRIIGCLVGAGLFAGIVGGLVWWKFSVQEPQELSDDPARFKYGSLGGEVVFGIPYPIFMVLPRVFPDLLEKYARNGFGPEKAGFGGYGAFGMAWEEGQRLPVGLSIKRIGYERVSVNCALCHTTSYRLTAGGVPDFALGGPSHTLNLQGLLRFLFAASHDRRFTAARLLPEIALQFPLDWIDYATYTAVLIPKTRAALHVAERELGWANSKPSWGPGRDDAFNLPKFILTQTPWDDSVGNTDFPALWRLGNRRGHLLHAAGEAQSLYAVIATSAIGIGALPNGNLETQSEWIASFISGLEPPKFPAATDQVLMRRGKDIFDERCADCHGEGGRRVGSVIPLAEIGTDPEHVLAWRQADADRMNAVVRLLGARHADVQGAQGGYVARPLVGLWLLGPYLHNGSVPTLRDLLAPPIQRPAAFYRGYDVVDLERVGFISTGDEAKANGFHFDTGLRGNGNGGHAYGTDLGEPEKRALLEYLKTL
jgi:mono/diheme cytochrome c family protein